MDKHTAVQLALNSIHQEYGDYFDLDLHEAVRRHLHLMYMVGFEQRAKIHKGKPIVQVLHNTVVGEFLNSVEAARILGYSTSCINKCVNGKLPRHKGYQWYKLLDWEKMQKGEGVLIPSPPKTKSKL